MALHTAKYFKDTILGRLHFDINSVAGTEFEFKPEFVVEVKRPEAMVKAMDIAPTASVLMRLEPKDIVHPEGLGYLSCLNYLEPDELELFISGLTGKEFDEMYGVDL